MLQLEAPGMRLLQFLKHQAPDMNYPFTKETTFVPAFSYVYFVCHLQKQGQAPFDSSSVDNMRRLLEHAGVFPS